MTETAESNPFSDLINKSPSSTKTMIDTELAEKIFLFTLRDLGSPGASTTDSKRNMLLPLKFADIVDENIEETVSEDVLSNALFERLFYFDRTLLTKKVMEGADEQEAILYLCRCFAACEKAMRGNEKQKNDCEVIKKIIITHASTCIRQPELFPDNAEGQQWLKLCLGRVPIDNQMVQEFLVAIVQYINKEDGNLNVLADLKTAFYPVFRDLIKIIANSNLVTLPQEVFSALELFSTDKRAPELGEVLIDYATPNPNCNGQDYAQTLFGQLFSISILPKTIAGEYQFFTSDAPPHTDPALWQLLANHQQNCFILIKKLLVLSDINRKKTLQWIGNCLHANVARGHLWSNINVQHQNASDAFMIGLTAVLLRLCVPLGQPGLKIFKVDPTYCAVPDDERSAKSINLVKMSEETCLLPTEENEKRVMLESANFVTEIFYMTHKSFEYAYRSCIERFSRMLRELHNLQAAYQDHANRELVSMMQIQMQKYLCMQNTLMEPENDELIIKFFEASAIWLTEISLVPEEDYRLQLAKKDFAPQKLRGYELPTEELAFIPPYLKSVPENIIENIVAYVNLCRHYPPHHYIELCQTAHVAFFRMIILFMGRAELMKNPHLRAKLAEMLEVFISKDSPANMRESFATNVLTRHPDRLEVVRSLLNVFVTIEMTGQSVQFEQKFNYRRPMYIIMEYLWKLDEQVMCFKHLADEAERNMEAIQPPLFLRFINLLINDAIFLLDESLSNLEQIRQLQEAQANGEWQSLSQNERQQQISNMHHLGMLARFDNILGRDTINILKLLTTEIKSIFCHSSMVDRIASMLNYFLLHLVGPQKERFNVRDKKEFQFDPAQTVLEICHIYVNLSSSDKFCLAISQDGRSYSSQLFKYAESILTRIRGGQLIGEIAELAEKVQRMEAQYKAEQEFISDAPDEYLDPIMSTLMTDPITLPSSKVTVDRSTIARHLLSDQTDPFNRAPLTMDKVISNTALKEEIEKWVASKRAGAVKNLEPPKEQSQ